MYSYDQEADVLYISFAPGDAATGAVELNENIWNPNFKTSSSN